MAELQAQADVQVQIGFDRPDAALAVLAGLSAAPAHREPVSQRVLRLARGLVSAGAGRTTDAQGAATALAAQAQGHTDLLAAADAALVQATLAYNQGRVAEVRQAAQSALQRYDAECPQKPGCDWRSSWHALQLLARVGASSGRSHSAREQALAAAELARAAGDPARQAWALASAADLSAALGDHSAELQQMARAQRLARLEGSALLRTRIKIFETRLYQARNDADGARRAAEQGLRLAHEAQSPRLQTVLLANLSDVLVKTAQPQAALQAVERALPVARQHGDRRVEQVLLHNAALARISLGQRDAARRTLDELLQAHASSGASGDQAVVLREFADAFAAAGDPAGALALYHRERTLAAEIMAANRDAALAELSGRFNRDAQQRRLQQLSRESALVGAQLDNRNILHWVWLTGAAVLLLAVAVVALLYRRVREVNRRLASNHALLRAQSQRDPLTGLANRRAMHEQALARRVDHQFNGGLLLVDIDHFKRVNDDHGHASGDLVLVEVAQRLAAAVNPGDLVVRWGGEEFLIFMPGAGLAQAQAVAARVLQAVGGTPVALPGGPLRVTASLGYGGFPLPPAHLPLSLERAINLADMALYTAKNQGRNRAVGIASVRAADTAALQQLEADFDLAWHEGRISLLRLAGPADPTADTAAGTAAAAVAA